MRTIDADKLYPDCLTKTGRLAISQSQIAEAPTVERPQGEWIKYIRCIECSVCKNKFFADDEDENCQDYEPCTDLRFNFCPNCGADMRGEKEE